MTSTDSRDNSDDRLQQLINLNDLFCSAKNDADYIDDGLKVELVIHHQFPGVELVSPDCYSLFATCYLSLDQRVNVGSTTQAGFSIDLDPGLSMGILMYKLQRKNSDQSNEEDISSEEEAVCTQLVIVWKVDSSKEFRVHTCLIGHDEWDVWNRFRLVKLANRLKLVNIQHSPIEDTWLTRDNRALVTSLNATLEEECYKLEIIICEGIMNNDTRRPVYFDVDNVEPQPTMKVNIHNQYSGFGLRRLSYINVSAKNVNGPDEEVDAGGMDSFDLIYLRPTFHGIITYILERKNVETGNRPELMDIRLFVAWKSEGYKKFRVFAHLIECDKQLHWSTTELDEYYQRYINQLHIYNGPIEDTWLIPDGTVLKTRLELDFALQDGALNITISEGIRNGRTKRPKLINPESLDRKLNITIRNQYPNLELSFPIYFSNGTTNYLSLNQQTSISNVMETSFGIDPKQKDLKCVSLYKLQRKHVNIIGNWPSSSTAHLKNITDMYLLVAWVAKDYDHKFCVYLIEPTDYYAWDEDKLWALYREYSTKFCMNHASRTITWLMKSGSMMEMRLDVTYGSDYKLDIILSRETKEDDIERSIKIDPKSLPIRPSFKLNIHNNRSNADLAYPVYMIGEKLECHRPPKSKVYAGDTMKSSFIIKSDDASYGALIYKLQRRQTHKSTETNKDTTSATCLLVVWEIDESKKKLYADALLVEHRRSFFWDEDDVRKLYSRNNDQFRMRTNCVEERWLLDGNVTLQIGFRTTQKDRILDIFISEVARNNRTRVPAHIDTESYELQLPECIIIHNECPNIKLVSPVYFGNNAVCPKLSNQKIDIGTEMKVRFEINATRDAFGGALLYKLQRYSATQRNMDTLATEINENEAKCVQMLVAWKMEGSRAFLYAVLVEHVKEFAWNENKLKELYNKNHSRLKRCNDTITETWFVDNNMTLKTSFKIRGLRGNFELSISISEEERNDYATKPLWIDTESFTLYNTMDLIIDNQCTNIEMVSPVYSTKDTTCHIQFPQQVDSKSEMKVEFKTDINQDTFGGVLLYRMQWKEDASTTTQLLVIWGYDSGNLHSRVWLIEHESTLDWDKDKSERLYNVYNSRYNIDFESRKWFLDDNTKLKAKCETSHGGLEVKIIISEENDQLQTMKPFWVDSNSFILYNVFPVSIHNQCSDFELTSPAHLGHDAILIRYPDQKVNANTMTKVSLGKEIFKDDFSGVLIYKLHRKENHEYNADNAFTEDMPTSLQLLVIWKLNEEHRFCVLTLLIKHSSTITWNEDTLEKLYSMHLDLCRNDDIIEDTWILDDAKVLMTTSKWKEDSCVFEIAMSEETRKDDSVEPRWVPSNIDTNNDNESIIDIPRSPSPTRYSELDFIIKNRVDDTVLMHGICHMPKGEKEGNLSTMILPKRSAFLKVRASHIIAGRIKCCLVYELVDQKHERMPIMEDHQVFVAVRVIIIPFEKKYKASAVMFMAEKGKFTGSEVDVERLKNGILREHLVNNEHSFVCAIRDRTLKLKASFHPGKQASIDVTLEETDERVENGPFPFT